MLCSGCEFELALVAEGTGNQESLDQLKEMDCHFAQGVFIARPMPIDDFMKLLGSLPRCKRISA